MEQKLSDTLVKAIDRSNPMMQNLQLASRFNKLIDESANLENNKEAIIDVSVYTEPVEIEPTSGKDGMAKATVTLTNIPSGGSATAYAWYIPGSEYGGGLGYLYLDVDIAPQSEDVRSVKRISLGGDNGKLYVETLIPTESEEINYQRVSDTEFVLDGITYKKAHSFFDFTLW